MNVFIVYCHPCRDSFTWKIKESFIEGLSDAGHTYVLSDLYEMQFQSVISEEEYCREAFYREDMNIPADVAAEHEKINQADILVFIYPDFWTAPPAMLDGWFQRILTYGYAYGNNPQMKILKKALFLVTMGGSLEDEIRREQLDAMKIVMAGDRMHNRAQQCEFHVFDEMTRGYGNDRNRLYNIEKFTKRAYEIASRIK